MKRLTSDRFCSKTKDRKTTWNRNSRNAKKYVQHAATEKKTEEYLEHGRSISNAECKLIIQRTVTIYMAIVSSDK